jgi:tetratricopeptide (TPR) repeat protein
MVRASASGPAATASFRWPKRWPGSWARRVPSARETRKRCATTWPALESPDRVAASQDLAQATAADPDFGRAYVLWLDLALAQRNRAEADRVVEQARAHQDRFPALDRAELDLGAAAVRGDFHAQLEARRELARLDPADPNRHRALAEALMSMRDYDGAIVEFRRALSIRPDDAAALNAMGYAAAYSGDLPTAIRVLRGYEQLRPNEPNPLDSLGDAHFALGHFAEAEQFYLAAQAKAPGFLNGGEVLKAAQARLMTGDVPGATALFNRYLAEREAAHDPNAPYHAAAWSWQTGARRAAIASLDRLAQSLTRADATGPLRDAASRADAQAAIWLLNLGDRAGAAEHARKAVAEAVPVPSPLVAMVAFLAQPEAFPAPAQSPFGIMRGLTRCCSASSFSPPCKRWRRSTAGPPPSRTTAWPCCWPGPTKRPGDWQRAEPLLRLTPLPQASGLPMFSSLYFPRLFFLRGAVLERTGHRAEAARYYQMFRTLSGPDSAIWGEERRAPQSQAGSGISAVAILVRESVQDLLRPGAFRRGRRRQLEYRTATRWAGRRVASTILRGAIDHPVLAQCQACRGIGSVAIIPDEAMYYGLGPGPARLRRRCQLEHGAASLVNAAVRGAGAGASISGRPVEYSTWAHSEDGCRETSVRRSGESVNHRKGPAAAVGSRWS